MKIGILTHPLGRNYGGILQAWALQQTLKDLGFKPQTIDWDYHVRSRKSYCKGMLRFIIKRTLNCQAEWPHGPNWIPEQYRGLRGFVKQNICLSRRIPFNKIIPYVSEHYRTVIVGSDQVWRPLYIPRIETMFLPYEKKDGGKKIAYAASFGTEEWEYTDAQTGTCVNLLSDFDAVGVREKSALRLCEENLHRSDCRWVLDPTLLIDKERYNALCNGIEYDERGHVFVYILDENPALMSLARQKAEELKVPLKIVSVDANVDATDTVEKWLSGFRDAKYVVTDSFHGTVFSLIYKKEFAVFRNQNRGNARFASLLELFPQIKNRITDGDKLPEELIDWESVEKSLDVYRNESVEFLSNALETQPK